MTKRKFLRSEISDMQDLLLSDKSGKDNSFGSMEKTKLAMQASMLSNHESRLKSEPYVIREYLLGFNTKSRMFCSSQYSESGFTHLRYYNLNISGSHLIELSYDNFVGAQKRQLRHHDIRRAT
ncbi:hypothetical protein YC2023_059208 [Brassica napus]